jgi:antitoxin component of MazEF toxin-antitoxin module
MAARRLKTRIRPWGPDGAYVDIPRAVAESLGAHGQLNVRARINGVEFSKSLALRAGDVYRMALGKAVRQQAGVAIGDEVQVELQLDRG